MDLEAFDGARYDGERKTGLMRPEADELFAGLDPGAPHRFRAIALRLAAEIVQSATRAEGVLSPLDATRIGAPVLAGWLNDSGFRPSGSAVMILQEEIAEGIVCVLDREHLARLAEAAYGEERLDLHRMALLAQDDPEARARLLHALSYVCAQAAGILAGERSDSENR
jgi:hypothetical protein